MLSLLASLHASKELKIVIHAQEWKKNKYYLIS